jgi:hypothetical protein
VISEKLLRRVAKRDGLLGFLSMSLHSEFTDEIQRRLSQGQLTLSSQQRAILWRTQAYVWRETLESVPLQIKPLLQEGIKLILQAAQLVEENQENSDPFQGITLRLTYISDQIMEWSL